MTLQEKLRIIRYTWLNCTETYGFGHWIDNNSNLIDLYKRTNLNPIEIETKNNYNNEEILLINCLYNLLKNYEH